MIYLFLAEGFEEIEALEPVDILRRAGLEVKTVAVGTSKTVKGAHGIEVIADMAESELDDTTPEAIILPGGMPGTTNLEKSAIVIDTLMRSVMEGSLVCAICAAPSILGKMRLLDGRNAAVYPGFDDAMKYANVTGKKVEHDDIFITAEGMGVSHEFGFKLIEVMFGAQAADDIRNQIRF